MLFAKQILNIVLIMLHVLFPQGLQVSFTLVNSDPDSVLAEWDIESAVKSEQKPSISI